MTSDIRGFMMLNRLRSPVATITVGAAVGALSAAYLAAAPAANAAACSATRNSTMYVTGRANQYMYETFISSSGAVTTSPRRFVRKGVNTGYAAITVFGCKNPRTGRWSALGYKVDDVQNDLDLIRVRNKVAPRPHVGDRGFGVFVRRTTANRVEISSVVCRVKPAPLNFLGAAKFISGLPIPIKDPRLVIGQWIVNQALPSGPGPTYPCGELGAASIPWSFSKSGVAQLHVPGHYLHYGTATWQEACTLRPNLRYCGMTYHEGIEVRAGR
jgi:hypothetical protein